MHSKPGAKFIQRADPKWAHSNRQRIKREDIPRTRGSLQDHGILLQLDVQPEVHKLQRKVQTMNLMSAYG